MALTIAAEAPPLEIDSTGTIRVGGTRIALDFVVEAHRAGMTPEQIAERYETLHLADVYAAIGYAIRHEADVNEYLTRREAEAAEIKTKILARQKTFPTRSQLLARRQDLARILDRRRG